MVSVKLREEIGKYIEQADDRFLQLVYGMMKADEVATIGYDPDGTALTRVDLLNRAKESNKAIEEGRTKSIDQVRENMKNWK